jgi:hypothetical protein
VAEYYLEMIWTSSSVKRAIGVNNQEALQDAIAMIVHKNFEKARQHLFILILVLEAFHGQ